MARKTIKLKAWSTVAADSDTSLTLPVGGNTYERITIEYTGVTLAQMKNIEVRLNGDAIQHYKTGQQLEDLNDFYGRPKTAGILTLWFLRPEMTNIGQRRLFSLGTLNIQTLGIHMEIDAAAAAPALVSRARIADPRDLVVITKIKQFPYGSAVSGQVEVDNIPRGPRMMALHFFKTDISDIEIEMDEKIFYRASKASGEAMQKEDGRVPITARCTHIDLMGDDDVGNAIVTANARDLRFRPTLASAGNTDILVEYMDNVTED